MIMQRNHQSKAECVFGQCGHAKATHILIHEFANYPNKYLCDDHAQRIMKWAKLKVAS